MMKHNERSWAIELIAWIKEWASKGETIFQDASGELSLKVTDGKTRFPDVLLFSDKTLGTIFNGWELKLPDTSAENKEMLENALEKAVYLGSTSFVTWNGRNAMIWKVCQTEEKKFSHRLLKAYEPIKEIKDGSRESFTNDYNSIEPKLKELAKQILFDLAKFRENGEIQDAISISEELIKGIQDAGRLLTPQLVESIKAKINNDTEFDNSFRKWKIAENTTIGQLEKNSIINDPVNEFQLLAQFTFYKLVGKLLFYSQLASKLPQKLQKISITENQSPREQIESFFEQAKKIDYQAVFNPDFTDGIEWTEHSERILTMLVQTLLKFDFDIIPPDTAGHILEQLVPANERRLFGQYFTPFNLSLLVCYASIKSNNNFFFDPTSGTGSFLNAAYHIFQYRNLNNHSEILNRVWGNDISHFPAMLSVINLYRQNVTVVENFPRVIRKNIFDIKPSDKVEFPDNSNFENKQLIQIPHFDAVATNFPFIQQEDIAKEILNRKLDELYNSDEVVLRENGMLQISERSDFFAYCIYYLHQFIKTNGKMAFITSNAWLGKEYGTQLKRFLLENYHIKYIVRSVAEHWFVDSKVTTLFTVIEKRTNNSSPTHFISINRKLDDWFEGKKTYEILSKIDLFYEDINFLNEKLKENLSWKKHANYDRVFEHKDGIMTLVQIEKEQLISANENDENWLPFFYTDTFFAEIDKHKTALCPSICKVFRGERTGWNPMFVLKNQDTTTIEAEYLTPYLTSSSELKSIAFDNQFTHKLFTCTKSVEELKDTGALAHISKFEKEENNVKKPLTESLGNHRPYWYSLTPKRGHIVTSINPYKKLFFSHSLTPFTMDQRLIALEVQNGYEVRLISALLNSCISLLSLEFMGTARYEGALDLNKNFLDNFKILDPARLSSAQKASILDKFSAIEVREVKEIEDELNLADRKAFDEAIFEAYGLQKNLVKKVYDTLIKIVKDRVELKDR